MGDHPHAESETTLRYQLEPVLAWLTDGGDPWKMDLAYWHRRDVDRVNRMCWEAMAILGHVDVTLDVFKPDNDPDRLPAPYSISEAQMRSEVLGYLADLRQLGYLGDWSPPSDIARH
jgi:hypothetical protein